MSAELKVDAEINFNPTRFQQGLGKADQALDKTGRKGKEAFDKVKQAATGAKPAMAGFKQQADQVSQASTRMGQSMSQTTLSMIGLTQQATAAISTWQGLQKTMIAIEKIHFDVSKAVEDVTRKERELNEMLARGEKATQLYIDKTKDLAFVRIDLAIKIKELKSEEDAYNTSLINFALQMSTTVFFAVTTLSTVLSVSQKAWIANTLAARGFTLANIKAALSIRGVTAAMTVMAAHPLILIVLAAAVIAITAYDQNWLGVRDTLSGIAGTELPSITEALTGMSGDVLPEANAELERFGSNVHDSAEGLDTFGGSVSGATMRMGAFGSAVGGSTTMLKGFAGTIDATANKMVVFFDLAQGAGLDVLEERISLVTEGFRFLKLEGIDPLSPAMRQARNSMLPEIKAIGSEINIAFGSDALQNFINEMRRVGAVTKEEGNKMRLEFGLISKALTDLKKNLKTSEGASLFRDDNPLFGKNGVFDSEGSFISTGFNFSTGLAVGGTSFRQDSSRLGNAAGSAKGRAGGHSRFRRDTPGGKHNAFMAFEVPRIIARLGLSPNDPEVGAIVSQFNKSNAPGNKRRGKFVNQPFYAAARANIPTQLKELVDTRKREKQERITELTNIALLNNLSPSVLLNNADDFGSIRQAVQFFGTVKSIESNKDLLSDDSRALLTLHGPNRSQNAKILADQLSFMNIERFAAVGT